jgi:hypothetical protein
VQAVVELAAQYQAAAAAPGRFQFSRTGGQRGAYY